MVPVLLLAELSQSKAVGKDHSEPPPSIQGSIGMLAWTFLLGSLVREVDGYLRQPVSLGVSSWSLCPGSSETASSPGKLLFPRALLVMSHVDPKNLLP